jgi:hypothetical protein
VTPHASTRPMKTPSSFSLRRVQVLGGNEVDDGGGAGGGGAVAAQGGGLVPAVVATPKDQVRLGVVGGILSW